MIDRFEPLWGEWQIDYLIGAGSSGQVWQVRHIDDGRFAAVKEIVIPQDGNLSNAFAEGMDEEGAKYYCRSLLQSTLEEINLMREIGNCPNIMRFHEHDIVELDRDGEYGWVVLMRMERLVPLRTLLAEKLSVKEAIRFCTHICKALEVCAEFGIVHRDVKPDNIFYCPDTDAYKLGDFGIAHYLVRPTAGKGRAGTLTHMPPEVFQGAEFTSSADLYALGMIFYRLLNDNRIPLLPHYPLHFTPNQRDNALVSRLRGENPGLPRAASLKSCDASNDCLGVTVDADISLATLQALGEIAQKAIAAQLKDRFPSSTAFRQALEKHL